MNWGKGRATLSVHDGYGTGREGVESLYIDSISCLYRPYIAYGFLFAGRFLFLEGFP